MHGATGALVFARRLYRREYRRASSRYWEILAPPQSVSLIAIGPQPSDARQGGITPAPPHSRPPEFPSRIREAGRGGAEYIYRLSRLGSAQELRLPNRQAKYILLGASTSSVVPEGGAAGRNQQRARVAKYTRRGSRAIVAAAGAESFQLRDCRGGECGRHSPIWPEDAPDGILRRVSTRRRYYRAIRILAGLSIPQAATGSVFLGCPMFLRFAARSGYSGPRPTPSSTMPRNGAAPSARSAPHSSDAGVAAQSGLRDVPREDSRDISGAGGRPRR